jgi:hypothetical protein
LTHLHLTAIVLTIIFFLITFLMQKAGKNTKVMHMILRVMYIILLVSGGILFFSVFNITFLYILKAVFGILMIAFFEMILVRSGDGRTTTIHWILIAITCIFVTYMGLILPMGFYIG